MKRESKIRQIRYFSAVPLMIFGLLMVVLPNRSLNAVSTVFGAICSVIGLVELFLFLTEAMIRYRLIVGIAGAVLGTLFITVHNSFLTLLLQLVVGILIVVDGIYKIRLSLEIHGRGGRLWAIPLALSILMIVFGAIVIFWSEESVWLPLFFGLAIFANSVGELVVGFYNESYSGKARKQPRRPTRQVSGHGQTPAPRSRKR